MKYFMHGVLGLLAVIGMVIGCSSRPDAKTPGPFTQYFNSGWAENKLWDDGLAEVATYAAERTIYDKKRSFEYTLITVKEDFNQEFDVKTDDYQRQDLFPVIKVNAFCRISTDNYPYHYLTSSFTGAKTLLKFIKLPARRRSGAVTPLKPFPARKIITSTPLILTGTSRAKGFIRCRVIFYLKTNYLILYAVCFLLKTLPLRCRLPSFCKPPKQINQLFTRPLLR